MGMARLLALAPPRPWAQLRNPCHVMCSKITSKSPAKLLDGEQKMELLMDRGMEQTPSVRKLDALTTSSSGNGLSLLPASKLLQRCSGFIESEDAPGKEAQPRPFTVSIEGNIGSGKSTLLQHFVNTPGVDTHQEPVSQWTNFQGNNLLGLLYKDPHRWSFLFQSFVQLSRLGIHLHNTKNPVKLIERSLYSTRYCFFEHSHDSGHLQKAEYSVLCEYFEHLESQKDIGIDLIVYLRTTPEVAHARMLERGRAEEAVVPLKYIEQMHHYHDQWLLHHQPCAPPAPVLVVDADQDLEHMVREYELQKPVIMGQKAM